MKNIIKAPAFVEPISRIPAWGRTLAIMATLSLAAFTNPSACAQAVKKVAIFVENRAGGEHNDKIRVFEDMLTSRASSSGFRIINRETVVNSINNYSAGPKVERTTTIVEQAVVAQGQRTTAVEASAVAAHANRSASVSQEATAAGAMVSNGNRIGAATGQAGSVSAQRDASVAEGAAAVRGQQQTAVTERAGVVAVKHVTRIEYPSAATLSKLDEALSKQTSATRLAQSMGADFLLVACIDTLEKETRDFQDATLGVQTRFITLNLRASYRIVNAWDGAVFTGDVIKASKSIRQSANLQTSVNNETANELFDEASSQIAESIKKHATLISQEQVAIPNLVQITIQTRMNDLVNIPITVPVVRIGTDGRAQIMDSKAEVQALDVNVELDGFSIGSAPGVFTVAPGLHKIRFSREGFRPNEMQINCYDKQNLVVTLQMTEGAYARWKDNLMFLQDMEKEKKLTDAAIRISDAEVKKIEGMAKMFEQSGYKVDIKKEYKGNFKGFLFKGPIE